ncbi:MAG: hypothetical protein HY925_06260 [Elusimicrobia bacterium]|nr:hypothetical protein [Elusimicrobiota bacterium]
MRRIPLLCALAFLALPASAEEWNVEPRTKACSPGNLQTLEVTLPNILMHQLAGVASEEGAASVKFLRDHPALTLRISFVERDLADYWRRPFDDQPDVLMAYSRTERNLKIAHRVLHLDGRDEETFIRDKTAQRELTFAVADSFVHEISHAREREGGAIPHLLEDELLSFYRGIAFVLDALRAHPDFNRMKAALELQKKVYAVREELREASGPKKEALKRKGRELMKGYDELVTPPRLFGLGELAALARSADEFEALVIDAYKRDGLPSLWASAEERASVEREHLKEYQGIVDKIAKLEDQMGRPRSDPTSGEATKLLLREDIGFWSDPVRVGVARKRYAQMISHLKLDLERRRKGGELKPFAVDPRVVEVRFRSKTFE